MIVQNDSGQAQLEYILILIITMILAIIVLFVLRSYFTGQSLNV
ncbi:MAG: hypothetical protein AB7D17_03285 [Methanobacteriales archaeon]